MFRRFAGIVELERYSRRQLASPRGKQLILDFLERVPVLSRRYYLAALKTVWLRGIDLPWPVDNKADIGKLLKTDAPIVAAIPGELAKLLIRWRKETPCRLDEQPLLPWRNAAGNYEPPKPSERANPARKARSAGGMQSESTLYDNLLRYARIHGLPPMRPVDYRHWVATICRKAGLSKQASALVMGHDAFGGQMRDRYDNPLEAELLEEQRERMPAGTLGVLGSHVEITEGVPKEVQVLVTDYIAGNVTTM